jgi:alpha-mannosidase
MIGNAHIDPVWLWQWPEGYQEVRATFQSAVDRLDEYPEYVFTCDSALFFAWVEESDPALFDRIRAHVASGRFQVIGGWWIEPDCNIPAGESFVRQALYGQRYLRETFGITATTGANIDSFGHNGTIPQILAKSGCDSYVFLRPKSDELELPGPLFRWESPDGSSVLAYRIPHEYLAPKDDLGEHLEQALASLPDDGVDYAVFYGVGNHGGGPTIANLTQIRELGAPYTPSSLRAFFDDASANGDLPSFRGELQHHGRGCYTSHSGIKRWNRRTENLLLRAEKWSAIADFLGLRPYPHDALRDAWKLLLFNQFHDTLAGTSIKPAYEDARDQLGHAASLAANAFNAAVQSIARQIHVEHEDDVRPVVVFNPHPWRLRTTVEIEYTWMRPVGAHVVDDAGAVVPMQMTRPLTTMSSSRGRLVFPVDVPPLGYRTYRVGPGAVDVALPDVQPDREFATRAAVIDDRSDTWGHDVVAYDPELGEFERVSREVIETGPVQTIVRVESRYGASSLREDYVYAAGVPYVDVRVTLDWREQLALLKLRYACGAAGEATYEAPYGHVVRPANGDEEPGQSWVSAGSLAVANDAKYGYDVRDGEIGISAVRSPVWAWHDPRELEEGGDFEYMDQGLQSFTVRLVPHDGDWRAAGVVRRAAELNQPPFALIETYHDGSLPQQQSFGSDGGGDVVVTVLKGAEDGAGYVVRAYESSGREADAHLEFLGQPIDTRFRANEIKTFVESRETDLLES